MVIEALSIDIDVRRPEIIAVCSFYLQKVIM
jgi:hypothetical protein